MISNSKSGPGGDWDDNPSEEGGTEESSSDFDTPPEPEFEANPFQFEASSAFLEEREKESADSGDTLRSGERAQVAKRLSNLAPFSPVEIERQLLARGYRGQEFARRAGAVLAYRHMARLRREFLEDADPVELPPRENYLFLGATGSGKTFLIELLFREILKVPTVVADVTRFSETGYVGDDVQMLLSQLYEAADEDRGWASCGIVCLDEFDKLAASRSNARFAGEGTTKDVSGFGVQRSLLTLLSGYVSPFPTDFGFSGHGARKMMPLHNIMFIAAGAFSGLRETAELAHTERRVGFDADQNPAFDDSLVSRIGAELLENTRAFSDYGILPEVVGRFSRLVPFQPLDDEVLRAILNDTLIVHYQNEFRHEGVDLEITDAVIDHVIDSARRRETGARGLRASLVPYLEEAAFQTFGQEGAARVKLDVVKGEINTDVELAV